MRIIILILCSALGSGWLFSNEVDENGNLFQFGIIADCQYCADPGLKERKYSISDQKLQSCVDHFNTMDLAYVIHLGDFIDRDFESFEVVYPIYEKLHAPGYHVLGNHDFSVGDKYKALVPNRLGLSSKYYDFAVKGWRFVVLDGNDVSFHAYPEGSEGHRAAATYYQNMTVESPKWNGAVGSDQMSWLEEVLKKAAEARENVAVYCHFPVFPENIHNLWNANEVVQLLEAYPCVKAFINGHNHAGSYDTRNGIHYLTLKGMVNTLVNSYALIQVTEDSLIVTGYGREEDRVLKLRE